MPYLLTTTRAGRTAKAVPAPPRRAFHAAFLLRQKRFIDDVARRLTFEEQRDLLRRLGAQFRQRLF